MRCFNPVFGEEFNCHILLVSIQLLSTNYIQSNSFVEESGKKLIDV